MKSHRLLIIISFCIAISNCYICKAQGETLTEDSLLTFLYKYMPLPDSTDYTEEFYRKQIKTTLRARSEMNWGRKIPEREFLHYVLPIRVNNENMDDSRTVIYEILKDRIKSMTMEQAVLEVNHWCHEHVSYKPSDSRTSSPLSTMQNTIGRCGEESTFTVAALRSVGIPARQVYTPRWAHTDDNHAWVEAWVDGKWRFLGACEPEPVLDLGWFNAPASRAMMMHTKAFGKYEGSEQVVKTTPCYTEICVTDTYAPTSRITVRTVDTNNVPVKSCVQFRLYNYAEFYPLYSDSTDTNGTISFTCGQGDLLVWANKNAQYGFDRVSVGKQDTITIILNKVQNTNELSYNTYEFDITPPAERNNIPEITEEQISYNKKRLAIEDSLRNMKVKTFSNENDFLTKSMGNHATIKQFLKECQDTEKAEAILNLLSEKDIRDVSIEVLRDNYYNSKSPNPYILQQRVSNELLTPYRSELNKLITESDKSEMKSPKDIEEWINKNITIDNTHNPIMLCMKPSSVYKSRRCDSHSRDIFFVSLCRTLNFAARLNEITNKAQYLVNSTDKEEWVNVFNTEDRSEPKGMLVLNYEKGEIINNPGYYTHFTISKLSDGEPQLLNYPEDATLNVNFKDATELECGNYLLTTGTRLANGGVLSRLTFFTITENNISEVPLIMRESTDEVQVKGTFDSETLYTPIASNANSTKSFGEGDTNQWNVKAVTSILSTTGRGYFTLGYLNGGSEPTNHTLNDLSSYKTQLESWGRPIILIVSRKEDIEIIKKFPNLPSTVVFGIDTTGKIKENLANAVQGQKIENYPVFIIADTFNRVVFFKQGYTIGIGEEIYKTSTKLK